MDDSRDRQSERHEILAPGAEVPPTDDLLEVVAVPPSSSAPVTKSAAPHKWWRRLETIPKALVAIFALLASIASVVALFVSIRALNIQNEANRHQIQVDNAAAALQKAQQADRVSWLQVGNPDSNGKVMIDNASPNPIKYVTLRVFASAGTNLSNIRVYNINLFLGNIYGCKQGLIDISAALRSYILQRLHAREHASFFQIFIVQSIWFVDYNGNAWTEDMVGAPEGASPMPILDFSTSRDGVYLKTPVYNPAPGCS